MGRIGILLLILGTVTTGSETRQESRGSARAEVFRPARFPHRIWAACDFEAQAPDCAWFGRAERGNIPIYLGNVTALRAEPRVYESFSARMTGMNPVPGPCIGKVNSMYCRYFLKGGSQATFQHYSLSTNDNNHIRVSGLVEGKWSEVTLNFTRDARRNDGTPGVPFAEGERMDGLRIFLGKPGDGKDYEFLIDDVIFFANDPESPPESEPFPRRVLFLAAFDTGIDPLSRAKYFPGDFEILTRGAPAGSYWGVARAVPRKEGDGAWVRLKLAPPRPAGERTKLRFRYHLTGASSLTARIFNLTDAGHRSVRVEGLKEGAWDFAYAEFPPLPAGHKVEEVSFLVNPGSDLLIDEVVLFESGRK